MGCSVGASHVNCFVCWISIGSSSYFGTLEFGYILLIHRITLFVKELSFLGVNWIFVHYSVCICNFMLDLRCYPKSHRYIFTVDTPEETVGGGKPLRITVRRSNMNHLDNQSFKVVVKYANMCSWITWATLTNNNLYNYIDGHTSQKMYCLHNM